MKRHALPCLVLLTPLLCAVSVTAEESLNMLQNTPQSSPRAHGNLYFVWPDGRQAPAILQPDGTVILRDGSVPQGEARLRLPDGGVIPVQPGGRVDLSQDLSIRNNSVLELRQPPMSGSATTFGGFSLSESQRLLLQQGTPLLIRPDGTLEPVTVAQDGTLRLPDGSVPQESVRLLMPDGSLRTLPPGGSLSGERRGDRKEEQHGEQARSGEDGVPATHPSATTAPPAAEESRREPLSTLAAMLPKTDIPAALQAEPGKGAIPESGKGNAPARGNGDGKGTGGGSGKSAGKGSGKADGGTPKPAFGELLRIPPEAVKTGDLSFLEGCWEGTRPEYFSKRTIKECFCFDSGGRSGKRRISDPKGSRRCTGATRADMNAGGVLRVYSEGAYCDDGERWGAAEMTCRGSGRNTPCSWIFTDAQGGRQAYEIPFLRVPACGR